MLLTMEEECKQKTRLFPSPERLDKVEESMENLEEVVRERNRAYYELETGVTGERKTMEITELFGIPVKYTEEEHMVPKLLNKEWQQKHDLDHKDIKEFMAKYREQEYIKNRRKKTRDFNHVIGHLKRFPDMDMEALKEQYPDVDIEKAKNSRKCRGHFVPK